jgi:hypothetical protein
MLCWTMDDGTRKKVYTRSLVFEMCCVFPTDVSRKDAVLHWLAGSNALGLGAYRDHRYVVSHSEAYPGGNN